MSLYSSVGSSIQTPQSEAIPGRESEMKPNAAGGYAFTVDPWARLERFLILGTEGGTYYASERKITQENLGLVRELIQEDGKRVVEVAQEISCSGRAPRNTAALWTIAAAHALGDVETKHAARQAMPKVARTGTHLFQWMECMKQLGSGWGRSAKRAISDWYLGKDPVSLAYQLMKYRQREGWTHRDVLRLGHVFSAGRAPEDLPKHAMAIAWASMGPAAKLPPMGLTSEVGARLEAFTQLQSEQDPKAAARLIVEHRFTLEMVPKHLWPRKEVWVALFQEMPMQALLRNLGRLAALGITKPLSVEEAVACHRLTEVSSIRRSRLHPAAILQALKVYGSGEGRRLRWEPSQRIMAALDQAFGQSFDNVPSTGKRILLAVDASGSMAWGRCVGLDHLWAVEAAAAMAMTMARSEPSSHIVRFDVNAESVNVPANASLQQTIAAVNRNGGGTDASAPMRWAAENGVMADAIVILTDNESWYGRRHPVQALREYRRKTQAPGVKLVVVSMTATDTTIADPADPLQMDVVGFDAAAPRVIADFIRS